MLRPKQASRNNPTLRTNPRPRPMPHLSPSSARLIQLSGKHHARPLEILPSPTIQDLVLKGQQFFVVRRQVNSKMREEFYNGKRTVDHSSVCWEQKSNNRRRINLVPRVKIMLQKEPINNNKRTFNIFQTCSNASTLLRPASVSALRRLSDLAHASSDLEQPRSVSRKRRVQPVLKMTEKQSGLAVSKSKLFQLCGSKEQQPKQGIVRVAPMSSSSVVIG